MVIHGINKTTLLDFPEHLACTVFTGHCNFRCPFCHNGELVVCPETEPVIPEEDFFDFLTVRRNRLEGVAITGGEPTVNSDLRDFIKKIKDRDLLVKLDTNGTNPTILKELIDEGLLDYVAMDIKSSRQNYGSAAGLDNFDIKPIEDSVSILMSSNIPYEFRTTVCRELHNEDTFRDIAGWLKGASSYYLQSYRGGNTILADLLPDKFASLYPNGFSPYTPEEMKKYAELLNSLGTNTFVRGIA